MEEKSQLHLCALSLKSDYGSEILTTTLQFPPALLEDCATPFANETLSYKSSTFHLAVSAQLTWRENERVAGGLSVDILIRGRDASDELIIEVDGPSHLLRGSGADGRRGRTMRVNGYHAFKDRLLKKQGFKVLHIPYFEWDLLAGDAKRAEYLNSSLLLAVDN